ncbi:motility associated factor glycosyltransferase family protein [Roseburia hominis]|nr:motility associated factor glycosyltransferase family protein [Roseburia hominis]
MQINQKKKNLEILDRLYPGIKKLIEERKEELQKKEQVKIEEDVALNGETILKVKKDGRVLYLAGRRDPAGPAKNQIGLLGKIEATAPVFMIGLGNIHYLEELVKVADKNAVIMIYEPSFSIFYKVLEQVDIEKMFQDRMIVLCVEGINAEGYEKIIMQMLRGDRVAVMQNFILPNYEVLFLEQVCAFIKCLDKLVKEYRMEVNTILRYTTVKADNIFHNVNYIRTGYQAIQLSDVLPLDVPAIVVSAGPSLNKNIHELKKAKNRAFIIAVDTAIRPLLKEGIIPDMFAIVDGLKPLNLVELEACKEIPLITTDDAAKAVLEYHTGKKFFYNQGRRYINHLYSMNNKIYAGMVVGGSVATLALALSCYVGFQTIILVGQDFAYTNNKSHADGTFKEIMDTLDTSKYKMVEGNYEKEVPTDIVLNDYRVWFEEFIKHWRENGREIAVINATEGGAKIEGTEILALKDAIERECTKQVDIQSCFEQLGPVFDKEEQERILQFFHETPNEFRKVFGMAEEGEKLYRKLKKMCSAKNMDSAGYEKLLRKIKKINKKIESSIVYQFIEETMVLADQIIKTGQYREYASFGEEGMEIAREGIQYMELVKQCAKLFENLSGQTVGVL